MATKDKLVNLEDLKAVHDVDAATVRNLKNSTVDQGNKNLLWITDRTNRTINNVTFTFHDDGSFSAVGKSSARATIYLMGDVNTSTKRFAPGEYTFLREIVSGRGNIILRQINDDGTDSILLTGGADENIRVVADFETGGRVVMQVGNGVSVNGTFRFTCVAGDVAEPTYEPPIYAHDAKARMSIAANSSDIADLQTNAVRSDAQNLTTLQQTQARTNIGAGAASDVATLMGGAVRHDTAQTLGAGKVTARSNIGAAGADAIAPEYEQKAYGVGDYVWHEGDLYRCTTAIASAETWTAAHWTTATLADAVRDTIDRSPQRNLFFFRNPTDTSVNGINITYNADGSVTLSGTAGGTVQIPILATAAENLPAGTYTITRWRTSGDGNLRMYNYREGISNPDIVRTSEAFYRTTVTFDSAPSLGLLVPNNSAFGTGATFYYQIEKGSAASPYVKRFESNATSVTPEMAPLQKAYDNEFIKYRYLTFIKGNNANHFSVEGVQVLIGGNVRYCLYHADSRNDPEATKTYDIWHIVEADAAELQGSNFKYKSNLTTGGEWECTVRMLGWNDYHGGYAHGFETIDTNGLVVYADGVKITLADLTTRTEPQTVRELRIYESSKIKGEDNYANVDVVDHKREYIFNKNGLTINQSVKWNVIGSIGSCFLAMLPAAKACTSSFAADAGCEMTTFPTESDATWPEIPKVKKTTVFGNVSGEPLKIDFNIDRYPEGISGGDKLLTTDNNGGNYNKMYYVVSSGNQASVQANDVWYATTHYNFKIGV